MNLTVREACETDFEEIHILAEQIHQLHVENRPDIYANVDPLSREYFDHLISQPEVLALVAEADQRVVGFCLTVLRPPSENPLTVPNVTAYMDNLCIHQDFRRLGIGKVLFDETARQARLRGAVRLDLHVASFNQSAIRFYEELGMTVKNLAMEIHL